MLKGWCASAFVLSGIALSAAAPANAGTYILLDRQGASPNRVAVYAQTFVWDDSPIAPLDLENLDNNFKNMPQIKQIDVALVYEAVDKPYWTKMVMQFQCPSKSIDLNASAKKRKKDGAQAAQPIPMPASVSFRIISGQTRTKDSFAIAQVPASDWQTTTGLTMRRAYLVACNGEAVQTIAERTAYDTAGTFDPAMFEAQMGALGLRDTVQFPGFLFMHDVTEMTWAKLWSDVKTPPINNGRDLTPEEIAAYDKELKAKVATMQAKIERDKAATMASLQQQDTEFKFRDEIARVRGNRRTSKTETAMILAWQGKDEREVVIAMGAPNVSEAGGVRFLSYGQDYDSRYVVQRVVSGATWTEGVYKSCNIQFVLIPDAQSQYRVADVVVSAFRSGDGWAPDLCAELTEAPR
jgi:hypothetical protein